MVILSTARPLIPPRESYGPEGSARHVDRVLYL